VTFTAYFMWPVCVCICRYMYGERSRLYAAGGVAELRTCGRQPTDNRERSTAKRELPLGQFEVHRLMRPRLIDFES